MLLGYAKNLNSNSIDFGRGRLLCHRLIACMKRSHALLIWLIASQWGKSIFTGKGMQSRTAQPKALMTNDPGVIGVGSNRALAIQCIHSSPMGSSVPSV